MSQTLAAPLEAARSALERHAWSEAYELFKTADEADRLPPEDLESLAEAAWWVARTDEGIDALERAYAAYLDAGNKRRAAFVALLLAREYNAKLDSSVGTGWFKRAIRLLEDEPESVEHGYLSLASARSAFYKGNLDQALDHAKRALEIGTQYGDRDLQAYGLMYEGMTLVRQGRVEEGLSVVDEATVAAVGGELTPYATGIIYCNTISVCRDLADYRRAGEWTEAAKRWCERQAISGFPGVCRVHRAEIIALRGSWAEAEEEARRAAEELLDFKRLPTASDGYYEIGEIRFRMGDFAAAEEAFGQAHQLGRDPQPGLALLRLAEGKVAAAASLIKQALEGEGWDPLTRVRLLPAQVEIAVAAEDLDTCRTAVEDLERIARDYAAPAIEAAAAGAKAELQLAEGDAAAAHRNAHRAWRLWQEVEAPYEVARARVLLALAHRAEGNEEEAGLELRAALKTFEQLGAVPDARRIDELLAARPAAGEAARAIKTFMFTDIVKSTNLIEVIGDASWQDLLRWHNQTLRSLFADHRGHEVNYAGDGFFVAFDDATSAVDCAVAIQRRLAEHRRTQGFAPQVRIGLHTTEATKAGAGYSGRGVHEAARIGALAEEGEILLSRETLRLSGCRLPASEERTVNLKGISGPVEVLAVDWRASA